MDGQAPSVGPALHPPPISQQGLHTPGTFLWARAGLEIPGGEAKPSSFFVFFSFF